MELSGTLEAHLQRALTHNCVTTNFHIAHRAETGLEKRRVTWNSAGGRQGNRDAKKTEHAYRNQTVQLS